MIKKVINSFRDERSDPSDPGKPLSAKGAYHSQEGHYGRICEEGGTSLATAPDAEYDGFPFKTEARLLHAEFATNFLTKPWTKLRIGGNITWRTVKNLFQSRPWGNLTELEIIGNLPGDRHYAVQALEILFTSSRRPLNIHQQAFFGQKVDADKEDPRNIVRSGGALDSLTFSTKNRLFTEKPSLHGGAYELDLDFSKRNKWVGEYFPKDVKLLELAKKSRTPISANAALTHQANLVNFPDSHVQGVVAQQKAANNEFFPRPKMVIQTGMSPLNMTRLSLRGTKLFTANHGKGEFWQKIEFLPQLVELDLAGTALGYLKDAEDGAGLTGLVRESLVKLNTLNISDNFLSEDLYDLAMALRKNELPNLQTLCLSWIKCVDTDNSGLTFLLECLAQNRSLQALDISSCGCTAKTMFVLQESLFQPGSRLYDLRVDSNPIGVEGVECLNRLMVLCEPDVEEEEGIYFDFKASYRNLRDTPPDREGGEEEDLDSGSTPQPPGVGKVTELGLDCLSMTGSYSQTNPRGGENVLFLERSSYDRCYFRALLNRSLSGYKQSSMKFLANSTIKSPNAAFSNFERSEHSEKEKSEIRYVRGSQLHVRPPYCDNRLEYQESYFKNVGKVHKELVMERQAKIAEQVAAFKATGKPGKPPSGLFPEVGTKHETAVFTYAEFESLGDMYYPVEAGKNSAAQRRIRKSDDVVKDVFESSKVSIPLDKFIALATAFKSLGKTEERFFFIMSLRKGFLLSVPQLRYLVETVPHWERDELLGELLGCLRVTAGTTQNMQAFQKESLLSFIPNRAERLGCKIIYSKLTKFCAFNASGRYILSPESAGDMQVLERLCIVSRWEEKLLRHFEVPDISQFGNYQLLRNIMVDGRDFRPKPGGIWISADEKSSVMVGDLIAGSADGVSDVRVDYYSPFHPFLQERKSEMHDEIMRKVLTILETEKELPKVNPYAIEAAKPKESEREKKLKEKALAVAKESRDAELKRKRTEKEKPEKPAATFSSKQCVEAEDVPAVPIPEEAKIDALVAISEYLVLNYNDFVKIIFLFSSDDYFDERSLTEMRIGEYGLLSPVDGYAPPLPPKAEKKSHAAHDSLSGSPAKLVSAFSPDKKSNLGGFVSAFSPDKKSKLHENLHLDPRKSFNFVSGDKADRLISPLRQADYRLDAATRGMIHARRVQEARLIDLEADCWSHDLDKLLASRRDSHSSTRFKNREDCFVRLFSRVAEMTKVCSIDCLYSPKVFDVFAMRSIVHRLGCLVCFDFLNLGNKIKVKKGVIGSEEGEKKGVLGGEEGEDEGLDEGDLTENTDPLGTNPIFKWNAPYDPLPLKGAGIKAYSLIPNSSSNRHAMEVQTGLEFLEFVSKRGNKLDQMSNCFSYTHVFDLSVQEEWILCHALLVLGDRETTATKSVLLQQFKYTHGRKEGLTDNYAPGRTWFRPTEGPPKIGTFHVKYNVYFQNSADPKEVERRTKVAMEISNRGRYEGGGEEGV